MTVYQIVCKARFGTATELRNIHHYEFFGYTPDTAELQEAVDAIDTNYKSNLQSDFVNDISFYGYDVRRVDVGDLPTVEFTATAGTWSGTNVNDPLPTQVSALVTWKAPTTFPRTTRSYLFPMGEIANDSSGNIAAAQITRNAAFGDDMRTLSITGQIDADKVAVQYGGTPRAVTAHNDVLSVVAAPIWATQRRRRPGVGI